MSQLYRLKDLLPDYYDNVLEMNQLVAAEQPVLDELQTQLEKSQNNMFVILADSDGLSVFENMLGIEPTPGADLTTRRYNVLLQLLPPHPLTEPYLREVLDLLNIDAVLNVDGLHYRVDVVANPTDKGSAERLSILLNNYLPVNLTYTHRVQTASRLYLGIVALRNHITRSIPDLSLNRMAELIANQYTGSVSQRQHTTESKMDVMQSGIQEHDVTDYLGTIAKNDRVTSINDVQSAESDNLWDASKTLSGFYSLSSFTFHQDETDEFDRAMPNLIPTNGASYISVKETGNANIGTSVGRVAFFDENLKFISCPLQPNNKTADYSDVAKVPEGAKYVLLHTPWGNTGETDIRLIGQVAGNLNVAAKNLLPDSSIDLVIDDSTNTKTTGFKYDTIYGSLKPNTQYTFSSDVDVKVGTSPYISVVTTSHSHSGGTNTNVPINNGKIQTTFTTTDVSTDLLIYAGVGGHTAGNKVVFHHYQLEAGVVAHDWSPAPEDLAITNLNK